MLGVDVDGFLQDHVVLLGFGHLLDDAVGALEHLLQFLVLARVQVFLELAALALEVAVLVDQLLLALRALAFGQGGRLALELVGRGLERVAQVGELLLAAGELLLQLGLRGLGRVGLAEDPVGVDEADPELLRLRLQGKRQRAEQKHQALTGQVLHQKEVPIWNCNLWILSPANLRTGWASGQPQRARAAKSSDRPTPTDARRSPKRDLLVLAKHVAGVDETEQAQRPVVAGAGERRDELRHSG